MNPRKNETQQARWNQPEPPHRLAGASEMVSFSASRRENRDPIQERAAGGCHHSAPRIERDFFNNGFIVVFFLSCGFAQTSVNDSRLISIKNGINAL